MKSELMHLTHEQSSMVEQIKDNKEKIKMNKQLPYLVANIVEVKKLNTSLICVKLCILAVRRR